MRIGIDGSSLLKRRSGIGRYTLNLIRAMAAAAPEDRFEVVAFSLRERLQPDLFPGLPNVGLRSFRIPGKAFYLSAFHAGHPRVDRWVGGVDLFHSTNYFVFPLHRAPQIVTIHDLHFMQEREHAAAFGGRLWERSLLRDVHRVEHVLAVSEQTRDDVLSRLDLPGDRVTAIHEGVDHQFLTAPSAEDVQRTCRHVGVEPGRFLFWIGTFEPRKNLPRLVQAYRLLIDRLGDDCPPLLLAGGRGFGCEDLERDLETDPRLRDRVVRPGYISDAELRALYHGATLFVFPSLWEGFGLPPLEAMACGTPVVASDRSALPEVLGDACVQVDPDDEAAIAGGLESLLTSRADREELSRRGREIAREFTWERAAERTLALYREVLHGP